MKSFKRIVVAVESLRKFFPDKTFEDCFFAILCDQRYKEYKLKDFSRKKLIQEFSTTLLSKGRLANIFKLPKNHFIAQPFGESSFPDFVININNIMYVVECKSDSKGSIAGINCGAHSLPTNPYCFVAISCGRRQGCFVLPSSMMSKKMDKCERVFYRISKVGAHKVRDWCKKNPHCFADNIDKQKKAK